MANLHSRLLPVVVALGPLLWCAPAAAEDSKAVAMARLRFQEGVEYFDAARFEEARAAFLQAYALKPHPSILLNIAQCELKSGMYVEAAEHFAEYLAAPTNVDPTETSLAEQGLAEAKRHVAELRITTDVGLAEVFVDGRRIGTTPLARSIFVPPGRHTVLVQNGAHRDQEDVLAKAAEVHALTLALLPVRATVSLRPLPPEAPPRSTPEPPPESRPPFAPWLVSSPVGITGLIVTGVGVGLGVAGSIVASDRYGAAQDASDDLSARARADGLSGTICTNGTSPVGRFRTACADRQDLLDQGDTWRGIAVGSFVVAGAAAAGTVVYYFLGEEQSEPEGRRGLAVVPILNAEQQGFALSGTF